jgi:hypothetical protein
MPPPYAFIDLATGKPVETDGQAWENLDVAPGHKIEVYDVTDNTTYWPRVSPGTLVRPGGATPEPPDPTPPDPPIPPTPDPEFDGMDHITNENQLADALQTYARENRVGMMYAKSPITMTKTITLAKDSADGTAWGACGNHIKLNWGGPGGQDMVVIKGVNGVNNRMAFFEKFSFFGNGYAGAPAGVCFKMSAPDGDPGCLYKFTLRDIFTAYATYGIVLEGAVYEGLVENCHGENHLNDGFMMQHLNLGSPNQAVVSNIAVIHPNMSRNYGCGMRQVYSCNSIFGSYVLNGEAGVVGPDGIRRAMASNGENTGESVFKVGHNGYGSLIDGNEASTNCSTVCSKWDGSQWVAVGLPTRYLLDDNRSGIPQAGNHISTYGGDGNVAIVKP